MFVDNPLVGQGPKMFRVLCNDVKFNPNEDINACSTHPHNLYVQLLAETGLLGLIFLLAFCFTIVTLILNHIVLFIKKRESLLSDFQICWIACFIMNLWTIIPSMNFFSNLRNVIFCLPVGFFLYSRNNR